jgi:hypothetical protein
VQGHEKEELVVSSHALTLEHKIDLEKNDHMALPCQIKGHALVSLVDNGASGIAFISFSFAQSLDLTLYPLSCPRTLVAYDGKAAASAITQYTVIPLHISRHSENLPAFVAPIPKWLLILGLPWLAKHNPYIDWKRQKIIFRLDCIKKKHCEFETTVLWGDMHPSEAPVQPLSTEPQHPAVNIIAVSAISFAFLAKKPGSETSSLSLRQINQLLERDPHPRETSQSVRVGNASMKIDKNVDLRDVLPPQYHSFLDVFDRKEAEKLSPHRLHDHEKILKLGAKPPHCKIYPMGRDELQA